MDETKRIPILLVKEIYVGTVKYKRKENNFV